MNIVHFYCDTLSERQKCMCGRQESVVGTLMSPRAGRQNDRGSIPSKREKCFSSIKASTPVLGSTQLRIHCFQRSFCPGVKRPGCEFDSLTPNSVDGKRECSCNLQPSICLHSVRRNKFIFAVAACVFFPEWFQTLWLFATRYWCLVLFVSVLVSITSYCSTLYAFSALVLN